MVMITNFKEYKDLIDSVFEGTNISNKMKNIILLGIVDSHASKEQLRPRLKELKQKLLNQNSDLSKVDFDQLELAMSENLIRRGNLNPFRGAIAFIKYDGKILYGKCVDNKNYIKNLFTSINLSLANKGLSITENDLYYDNYCKLGGGKTRRRALKNMINTKKNKTIKKLKNTKKIKKTSKTSKTRKTKKTYKN